MKLYIIYVRNVSRKGKKMRLNLLKGKIVENELTLAKLAPRLKMSAPSLSKKLNGKADFTLTEIRDACVELGIEKEDIGLYFFTEGKGN